MVENNILVISSLEGVGWYQVCSILGNLNTKIVGELKKLCVVEGDASFHLIKEWCDTFNVEFNSFPNQLTAMAKGGVTGYVVLGYSFDKETKEAINLCRNLEVPHWSR